MAPVTEFPDSQSVTTKPDAVSRNLPWVEKYRPQKLTDLISHADILGDLYGCNCQRFFVVGVRLAVD